MTIQQLNYAIAISEAGSISKAAEQLYISQPSLTGSIQELEKEIGFQIFHRGGRGVTLTPKGADFIIHARTVVGEFRDFEDYLGDFANWKRKFAVSTQHYSFAVKAFVELVNELDSLHYEFAIRETQTHDVITDVANGHSEIGILYLSDFNRSAITKLFKTSGLEFHPLTNCKAYVYLWSGHPLAGHEKISFEELEGYPCLMFEQGDFSTYYFAEEILSTEEYPRIIKANDRATMLNLMVGVNGYTLCSGIICEELNGSDYLAIPFDETSVGESSVMEIGYITKKNTVLSDIGEMYVNRVKAYLDSVQEGKG